MKHLRLALFMPSFYVIFITSSEMRHSSEISRFTIWGYRLRTFINFIDSDQLQLRFFISRVRPLKSPSLGWGMGWWKLEVIENEPSIHCTVIKKIDLSKKSRKNKRKILQKRRKIDFLLGFRILTHSILFRI